jgi:xanthine dehydrogenase YagR molybdenum-binding subunit
VARLIRTEKEVEGRFEEVWLVVEEDPLDQWPDGPRDVVGRPAPRQDGVQRATGKALYTADIQLPGMLHAAVLRSPHARARVKKIEMSSAREAAGVRAVLEPGPIPQLAREPNYQGQPDAAVAA